MNIFNILWNGLVTLFTKMSELADFVVNKSITVPILTEIREPPTTAGGYGQIYHDFVMTDVSIFNLLTNSVLAFVTTIIIIKIIKAVLDCIPVV